MLQVAVDSNKFNLKTALCYCCVCSLSTANYKWTFVMRNNSLGISPYFPKPVALQCVRSLHFGRHPYTALIAGCAYFYARARWHLCGVINTRKWWNIGFMGFNELCRAHQWNIEFSQDFRRVTTLQFLACFSFTRKILRKTFVNRVLVLAPAGHV